MTHTQLSKLISRYVDKPFHLGGAAQGKGWDCLTMIMDYTTALGCPSAAEWEGYTLENYAARWANGEGRDEFIRYLQTIGRRIEPAYMSLGDILICRDSLNTWGAIYLGQGHLITACGKGMKVVPLKCVRDCIIEVRRCL